MRLFSPLWLVLAACALPPAVPAGHAREFQGTNSVLTLSTLTALPGQTLSGLVQASDGNFYGVTESGGSFSQGTVFQATLGGGLAILHSFTGGADGAAPAGGLALGGDGFLYGAASSGGNTGQDSAGAGTIFRITTNGDFTLLYSFTGGSDGDTPFAALAPGTNGNFYGTTEYGGDDGYGTLFQITPGGALTRLYSFDYTVSGGSFSFDNGSSPGAALVSGSDGWFYGTTPSGGAEVLGTVFSLAPDGTLTTLVSFDASSGGGQAGVPGPQMTPGPNGLFYGTTFSGGVSGQGTVFQVTLAGTLTTLYAFTGGLDGGQPVGGLLLAPDGYFYGTTRSGGAYTATDPAGRGYGTLFQMSSAGALTNLYSFTGGTDGGAPSAALILGSDGAFYGTTATTLFRLGPTTPPFILTQPASQTNTPGNTASFTVSAGGSEPLGYQWQFNGANLNGANGAALILTNAQLPQAGGYSVVVTNAAGSVTSSVAVLVILVTPPSITTQPLSQALGLGSNAVFSVVATGSPPLSYQWRWNGTNLAAATNPSLVLTNVQLAQNGNYAVVVSNAAGSVASVNAVLNVTGVPPEIVTQPSAQSAASGKSAAFRVAATGSLPLGYQWQFNSVNLPGQTGPLLTLTNIQWLQEGNYRVVISNPSGSLVSLIAPLVVQPSSSALSPLPLYSFTNGLDGSSARATLVGGPDGALYGTASAGGGTNNAGTVYRVTTNGVFSLLHTFTNGVDGGNPQSGLVPGNDGALYGVTAGGGIPSVAGKVTNAAQGAVYRITTNGVFSTFYSFISGANNSSGPSGPLIVGNDGNFYGMTAGGGLYGNGTIFRLSTNPVLTVLHSFTGNGDGGNPSTALLQGTDSNLYGTTTFGGVNGAGVLFRFTTRLAFSALHAFDFGTDGGEPMAAVVQGTDGNLYGTAPYGGANGAGVVFRSGTNTLFNTIYSFTGGTDGSYPQSALTPKGDGSYYGVTPYGGPNGAGTVFQITTNGVFTTIATFSGGADGGYPQSGVTLAPDGGLFGTTSSGGAAGYGGIFKLGTLAPPKITIQPSNRSALGGDDLDLGVQVSGTGPFVYQWQLNGMDVAGATGSTVALQNLAAAAAGDYTVIVRDAAGSVTSAVAAVTLQPGIPLAAFALHSFTNGLDGATPSGALWPAPDGSFYGTTGQGGGTNYGGTILRITTNGELTVLHTFMGGADGAQPQGGLVQGGDGALYGTTALRGGTNNAGTVFRLAADGTFTTFYTFQGGSDGANPAAGLIQGADGGLYGVAGGGGGTNGAGTIFRLDANGGLSVLHAFTGAGDGSRPGAALRQDAAGNLYGTTTSGGAAASGTLFQITTNGGFTTLSSFTGGGDGGFPASQLVQTPDGGLYGTTDGGGYGSGTVFRMSPDGSVATIYSFTGGDDGGIPSGGLVMGSDGRLYGTTQIGGAFDNGTLFALATNGTLATICVFTGGPDGGAPSSMLQAEDGNFYGVASSKGQGWGVIFALRPLPPPVLDARFSSRTAAAGDSLQLGAVVSGPGPFSYQWLLNGTNVPGATSQTLSLLALTAGQAGSYSVAVADAAGSVTGLVGNLVVQPAPAPWITTALHGFGYTTDGGYPMAGLIQGADGGFYGVTYYGGASGAGTVFRMVTNGGFSTLHNFNGTTEGGYPGGGLIQASDGKLYGATTTGGAGTNTAGTLFRLATNGGTLTILHSFSGGSDGGSPGARLLQAGDGNLYGATSYGGSNGSGTVFRTTLGGSFATIHDFDGLDGSSPSGLLQGTDGNLYGTTAQGGSGIGTVFQLGTNGALTTLYRFTGAGDGAQPEGGLASGGDGSFYGVTYSGGANGSGTVFQITTNGTLTTLYAFTGPDGAYPEAELTIGSDGDLYGTTSSGGDGGSPVLGASGTAFRITPDGVLTTLHSFLGATDGAYPTAALLQGRDGNFYGTTETAGANGYGTVFRLVNPNVSTNSPVLLLTPLFTGSTFRLSVQTQSGVSYNLESKNALTDPQWTTNQTVIGTGSAMILSDTNAVTSTKFYRVKTP